MFGKIVEGAHDIMIIGIRYDPDNTYKQTKIISHRSNIYVKNGKFKKIMYKKLISNKQPTILGVIINKNHTDNLKPLTMLMSSQKDNYYIHVNNMYNENSKYSLIVMLNSKQIPVKSKETIFYFEQQKLASSVIPIEINTSTTDKTDNELLAIVVDNPYSVLEPKRGVYSAINANIRVSNKVLN